MHENHSAEPHLSTESWEIRNCCFGVICYAATDKWHDVYILLWSLVFRVGFLVMFGYNQDTGSCGENQSMSIQRFFSLCKHVWKFATDANREGFFWVLRPRWYLKCPWDIVKGKVVLKAGPLSMALFISFPQHPFGFPVSHSSYCPQVFCFVCLFVLSFFYYMSNSRDTMRYVSFSFLPFATVYRDIKN